MTPEAQKDLLAVWAVGTTYSVDPSMTPKAEFARLAQAKGWVGGSATWCTCWEACFGESYPYKASNSTTVMDDEKMSKEEEDADLEESMRRLSVGSVVSDFSLVSRTSRADSFDSVRSLDSDGSCKSRGSCTNLVSQRNSSDVWTSSLTGNSWLSLNNLRSLNAIVGGYSASVTSKSMVIGTEIDTEDEDAETLGSISEDEEKENPRWYGFRDFIPEPSAPFRTEFERLARSQGWTGERKRHHLINTLSGEVEFHFGDGTQRLHDLQELCEDLGIEDVPMTLTQCRNALRAVKVNLWSFIDHKRNPQSAIFHFSSHRELRKHIGKKGNRFPRQCAKAGSGVVTALLHKLY